MMSVALDSNRRIQSSGFACGITAAAAAAAASCTARSVFQEPYFDKTLSHAPASSSSSSSSSSIGKNSDLSAGRTSEGHESGEDEAQSSYKGHLDVMDELEQVLPIRRGISNFYCGKSKSYTSLADACCSSTVKDIAKPENAYTRRRRNLLAFNHVWDKNRNLPLRSNGGGISKKQLSTSRSTLALAVAMSSSESNSDSGNDSSSNTNSRSPPSLPPLYPTQVKSSHSKLPSPPPQRNFSPWRSFSLADLQHCSTSASTNVYTTCLSHNTNPSHLT